MKNWMGPDLLTACQLGGLLLRLSCQKMPETTVLAQQWPDRALRSHYKETGLIYVRLICTYYQFSTSHGDVSPRLLAIANLLL